MNAPLAHPINGDALPIEIDPRPCELCGRTIDQHECVDTGEGPGFFCYPEDDIVTSWELADPRDRWRHTGEAPPKISATPRRPEPYRPAESTVQAFWFVATREPEKLKAWLARHPDDAPALRQIWKAKRCSK
jgi:hypothetical protein